MSEEILLTQEDKYFQALCTNIWSSIFGDAKCLKLESNHNKHFRIHILPNTGFTLDFYEGVIKGAMCPMGIDIDGFSHEDKSDHIVFHISIK
jgi:hypothetical protein